ncbi:hypothetical protein BGZ94_000649 [Podila epigama]|nr:hypothetical protein BGZ94_000649 [Podila epigama]
MAEETITVSEYIAEQERLEKEAKELFPKKFDVCTYGMGYIRQPVYSCLTCNPTEEAGFCYSCSISCHGDHELVELFTKRDFRCDCGTNKFKIPCKLDIKSNPEVKSLNKYNHNYLGRFCWCDILYDPNKEESTMLQCVVCEDWFHDTCIGITPHGDDFEDFICRDCTKALPFLRRYAQNPLFMIAISSKGAGPKAVTMIDCSKSSKDNVADKLKRQMNGTREDENAEVDVVSTSATDTPSDTPSVNGEKEDSTTVPATSTSLSSISTSNEESSVAKESQVKRSVGTMEGNSVGGKEDESNKRVKLDSNQPEKQDCKLKEQPVDPYADLEVNLFASEGWRDLLCQCPACINLYNLESCRFITGEEEVYEDEDDDEPETSILESGMKKLNEMDRVNMMEGMLAYSKLRDEIRDFLAPFSEQGKTVTASDIQAFFASKMEEQAASRKPNFF